MAARLGCLSSLLTVVALAVVVVAPGSAAPAQLATRLGVYVGAANTQGVDDFSSWLGAPVGYEEDYLATASWNDVANPTWALRRWRGSGRVLVLGVPLVPASGGTLADGAAGRYDRWFAQLAHRLVEYGQGDAILRLGWEFNGGWYRWGVKTNADAAAFAAYFREVVTTMRAVAPSLRFDWNPSVGVWPTFDLEAAYPGDAFVDFVGLDVYDQSWISDYTNPSARWQDFVDQKYGLAWQRRFARAHGKPVSFPEWGLTVRPDGHGGGDDPYYVEQMAKWIGDSAAGYAVYFDYDASDGSHALDAGAFPAGAAAFRRLFA